jgi:galactan endo-1,6-beta-galactosidase
MQPLAFHCLNFMRFLILGTLLFGSAHAASVTVSVSPFYVVWEGWGVSLCWWAGVFGTREDIADALYTLTPAASVANNIQSTPWTVPALGLNIARYNVGGSSTKSYAGASMTSSGRVPQFRFMDGYWIDWASSDPASSSWDWSRDFNQRSMLQLAHKRGADKLEMFSNTPMWWMLDNHNICGAATGGTNLQAWNQKNHSVYMATVAKYARDHWGIEFNTVEPFNEPSSWWWNGITGTQEGCHFDADTMSSVIKFLREELDARGLNSIQVSASDENTYDLARDTWSKLSADARQKVGRVNTHGYQKENGRRDLLYSDVHSQGKALWNSEYGEDDASGLTLAKNLNLDFEWLHNRAWVYWQALDSGGWGLIESNPGDNWIGHINTKWYVLAHYSRHIRQGFQILQTSMGDNVVAAYDPVGHKMVIVCLNADSSAADMQFQITSSDFQVRDASQLVSRWETDIGSGKVLYAAHQDLKLSNNGYQLNASLQPKTIQTFEITQVWQVHSEIA